MHGRHGPGPTNLYERIVIELAGWDPKLADELCQWNDDDLLGPKRQLQALAAERDRTTLGWREGTLDSFGARQLNTSYIILRATTTMRSTIGFGGPM